jgi:hypothetical protein
MLLSQTLLTHIIFERGVSRTLRTDNAPELSSLSGAVSAICEYLKICQIRTGGHNPRGNSICERVKQSIGSMIRKLTDQEYKQLRKIALPAFQYALNTTFNSAIGCTPFEAGHGLQATTIAQARLQATREATTAEGGRRTHTGRCRCIFRSEHYQKTAGISNQDGGICQVYVRMASKNDCRELKSIRAISGLR